MVSFLKKHKLIIFVLLLSAFLRFYRLPELMVFDGDSEHHVLIAETLVQNFHIIWIGVNVAHLGLYHGPLWEYFTAFFLWLGKGDLVTLGYAVSAIGVLTTFAVYFLGTKFFNRKIGVLGGVLYATLPFFVYYDQKFWNPSITMLLSLCIVLSLYMAKTNTKWWILFAGAYGLVFHTHFSLLPLGLLALFVFLKYNGIKKLFDKYIIASALVFLLLLSPLIVFTVIQRGANLANPFKKEVTKDQADKVNPKHHFLSFYETLGRVFYLEPNRPNSDEVQVSCSSVSILGTDSIVDEQSTRTKNLFLSSFVFAVLVLFLIKKETWTNPGSRILSISILLITVPFLFFTGRPYEYYLLGIFPFLLFVPLALLKRTFLQALFVIVLAILGINTVLTAHGDYGLEAKKKLVAQVSKELENNTFEIKQDTSICHQYEGWRQLFVTYGKTPNRSFSDKDLGWHYQDQISKEMPEYTVILGDKRVPTYFDPSGLKTFSEGGFKAYIIKN